MQSAQIAACQQRTRYVCSRAGANCNARRRCAASVTSVINSVDGTSAHIDPHHDARNRSRLRHASGQGPALRPQRRGRGPRVRPRVTPASEVKPSLLQLLPKSGCAKIWRANGARRFARARPGAAERWLPLRARGRVAAPRRTRACPSVVGVGQAADALVEFVNVRY